MAGEATEKSVFFSAQDGLRLHARVFGEPSPGLAVVCLPGLTRNARDFSGLARHLAGDTPNPRRVVAFDYRGRGLSHTTHHLSDLAQSFVSRKRRAELVQRVFA